MNRSEPKWTEWTEVDQNRLNESKWTELDRMDQSGLNWTKLTIFDQILLKCYCGGLGLEWSILYPLNLDPRSTWVSKSSPGDWSWLKPYMNRPSPMICILGSREYCLGNSTVFGPLPIDKTVGDQQGNGLIQVGPRVLLVPLGSSLLNVIWHHE